MSIGELQNFIESARRNKVPDAQTKERLESLGWEDKDIDEALHLALKTPEPVPTPAFRTSNPQFINTHRKSSSLTFVLIVLFLGLLAYGVWRSGIVSVSNLPASLLPR